MFAGCWAETQSRCRQRNRPPSLCCRPGGCNHKWLFLLLRSNICKAEVSGRYLPSASRQEGGAVATSGGRCCSSGCGLGQRTTLSHSCSTSEVRRRGVSEPGELDRYWGEGPGQSPELSTGASAAARAALTRSYLSEVTRQLAPGEEHGLHALVGLVGDEHEEAAAQHGAQEAEHNQPPHSHTCAGDGGAELPSPLQLLSRVWEAPGRRLTFRLDAERSAEAALLWVVRVPRLDPHAVPGPGLQAR